MDKTGGYQQQLIPTTQKPRCRLPRWELPTSNLRARRTPWAKHNCPRKNIEPHTGRDLLARVNFTKPALNLSPDNRGLNDGNQEQSVHDQHDDEECALSKI